MGVSLAKAGEGRGRLSPQGPSCCCLCGVGVFRRLGAARALPDMYAFSSSTYHNKSASPVLLLLWAAVKSRRIAANCRTLQLIKLTSPLPACCASRTFTTNYVGSLEQPSPAAAAAAAGEAAPASAATAADGSAAAGDGSAAAVAAGAARAVKWEAGSEQINRGMLMNRDPILLWCELPLYESELEDHGTSQVSVKVGVMRLVSDKLDE